MLRFRALLDAGFGRGARGVAALSRRAKLVAARSGGEARSSSLSPVGHWRVAACTDGTIDAKRGRVAGNGAAARPHFFVLNSSTLESVPFRWMLEKTELLNMRDLQFLFRNVGVFTRGRYKGTDSSLELLFLPHVTPETCKRRTVGRGSVEWRRSPPYAFRCA